ncbi:MAG: DUF1540 domain-containing protein [Cellulosilyticaceae bacterium]
MPKLNCGVSNCAHNSEDCCCLNQIGVAGDAANNSIETCCSNFSEQTGATNSMESPNAALEVECQANNCTHNDNCKCCAQSIDIAGQGASNCVDTCCSSFCER